MYQKVHKVVVHKVVYQAFGLNIRLLDNVALSQLEQFNEELELAMMVENKYEPELDEEG